MNQYRGNRTQRMLGVGAALVAALFLTSCALIPESTSEPAPWNDTLLVVDDTEVALPDEFAGSVVLDPEWATEAKELDGVLLAPRETRHSLEYIAVDSDGSVLWGANRPLSCTGFVLTVTDSGQAIAVLTDVESTPTAIAAPAATAYDLRTGEHVWGPVEVAGPYQGPGLVFAAAPEGFMGDAGARVALDPSTGKEAADERHLDGRRILGEHQGTVMLVDNRAISAFRPDPVDPGMNEAVELWSLPLDGRGWDRQYLENNTRHSGLAGGLVVLTTTEDSISVVDLDSGDLVADDVTSATTDQTSGVLVAVDSTGVRGIGSDGSTLWSRTPGAEVTLTGMGSGLAYVQEGVRNTMIDTRSGEAVKGDFSGAAEDAKLFLPIHVSEAGAAIVQHGQTQYLITNKPTP
ncbi:MAG: hypothetical protein ACTHW3_10865 [Leucobacter sp.]